MTRQSALAERLAPLSIAEIEAMTDEQIAQLMGASPDEMATEEDRQYMREAAIVATDEWHDRVAADISAGRARVITGGPELERLRHIGRPPLGAGESVQVRARLSPELGAALDAAVDRLGRPRSEIVREALAEYLSRHAS
jgi:predicted transcriptional regulator